MEYVMHKSLGFNGASGFKVSYAYGATILYSLATVAGLVLPLAVRYLT